MSTPTPTFAAFAGWLVAALHDTAVGFGVYDAPFVLGAGGYMAVTATLSAVLVRELVQAMDESERLGAQLHELAETRADALRAIDLRLARGEQHAAIGMLDKYRDEFEHCITQKRSRFDGNLEVIAHA